MAEVALSPRAEMEGYILCLSGGSAQRRKGQREGGKQTDGSGRIQTPLSIVCWGMVLKYREDISDLKLCKSPRRSLDGGVERDISDG